MLEFILVLVFISFIFGIFIAIFMEDAKDSWLKRIWMKSIWHRLTIIASGLLIVAGYFIWAFYAMAIILYHLIRYGEVQYDDEV